MLKTPSVASIAAGGALAPARGGAAAKRIAVAPPPRSDCRSTAAAKPIA
jgi:hypothetical protein